MRQQGMENYARRCGFQTPVLRLRASDYDCKNACGEKHEGIKKERGLTQNSQRKMYRKKHRAEDVREKCEERTDSCANTKIFINGFCKNKKIA